MLWRFRPGSVASVWQVGFQRSAHGSISARGRRCWWTLQGNEAADALSRLGSQRKPVPPNTFLDVLHNPSVQVPSEDDLAVPDPEAQLVAAIHVIPDWTVPYLVYLSRGELP